MSAAADIPIIEPGCVILSHLARLWDAGRTQVTHINARQYPGPGSSDAREVQVAHCFNVVRGYFNSGSEAVTLDVTVSGRPYVTGVVVAPRTFVACPLPMVAASHVVVKMRCVAGEPADVHAVTTDLAPAARARLTGGATVWVRGLPGGGGDAAFAGGAWAHDAVPAAGDVELAAVLAEAGAPSDAVIAAVAPTCTAP